MATPIRFRRAGLIVSLVVFLFSFGIALLSVLLGQMMPMPRTSMWIDVAMPLLVILTLHALFSGSPAYGLGVYLSESLGVTAAVLMCFRMRVWQAFVIFIVSFVVSYVGTLLRVKRLKRRGYVA